MTNERLLTTITEQAEEIGRLKERLNSAYREKNEKRADIAPDMGLNDMKDALLQLLCDKPNKILLIKGLRTATRMGTGEALYLGDCKRAVEKFFP
jgi:hypothetical protein